MDIDVTGCERGDGGPLDFIHSLWNQNTPTSDDIVTLKTEALAMTNGRLFIFSEYIRTKDRVNKARDAHRGRMGAVVVVGSPGIGKTCWLEYMALLEARAGRPFLFFTDNVFHLVREDGVYIIGPSQPPSVLLRSFRDPIYSDMVLFVDVDTGDVPPFLRRLKPFIIQAASPQHSHYKWLKQRSGGRLFIMNPHPTHELKAALHLYMEGDTTFTDAAIATAIADYGPNMREIQHALRSPKAALDNLIQNVGILKPHVLHDIVCTVGGIKTTHAIIKTFSLVVRSNSDIDDDTELHAVANKHIWRRLMDSQLYRQTHQVSRLFAQLSSVPQAATTAGWLFEAMAHRHICEGKPVFLTPLEYKGNRLQPSAERVEQNFPILRPSIFNGKATTDHTKDKQTYYIPSAANNPAFDAFARPGGRGIGFQMTLSSTHSLNAGGLQMLRARLKDTDTKKRKALFAFVVPYGRSFSCSAPEKRKDRDFFDFVLLEVPPNPDYATFLAIEQPEREDGPAALPPDVEMGDPEEE
ncbi:hypothetical protein CYLTODRAFT_489804 [Cylindrobasidium torrendii FP15055 ss-10]|uniref:Uncharacterized protein n=1 Tax=Cylindrobasidium torrendii FP15055 ss-10 TaxID=1314674 RepID=A0A0D7BE13_9AGAR|nr:hypothetical protein CYLTODRAFT_489804 [Cylindrobasidium torrendii FP15055 ss-10]